MEGLILQAGGAVELLTGSKPFTLASINDGMATIAWATAEGGFDTKEIALAALRVSPTWKEPNTNRQCEVEDWQLRSLRTEVRTKEFAHRIRYWTIATGAIMILASFYKTDKAPPSVPTVKTELCQCPHGHSLDTVLKIDTLRHPLN